MRATHGRILLALALLATVPAAPAAGASGEANFTTTGGTVTVHGTSSMHDWSVSGTTAKGSLDLPAGFLGGGATGTAAGSFGIAAKELVSEHDRMNRLMWEALRADKHPRITFELRKATLQGAGGAAERTVDTEGVLTVGGVARPVRIPFRVRQDGPRLIARGELRTRMTEFRIKPPTAMLGTMKTGDEIRIELEATFVPAPRP